MREQLWSWFHQARADTPVLVGDSPKWGAAIGAAFVGLRTDLLGERFAAAEAELRELQGRMPRGADTVFSHNDVLSGNVMLNSQTGEVNLIDFE